MGKRIPAQSFLDGHAIEVSSSIFIYDNEQNVNEGFPEIGEQNGWADAACVPDLTALRHAAHLDGVAMVLGDLWWSPERRVEVSPRNVLRAQCRARRRRRLHPVGRRRVRVLRLRRHLRGGEREGLPQPRAGAPHADRLLHLPRRPRRGAARPAVADVRRERHPGRVDQGRDGARPVRDHVRADRRAGGRRPRRARRSCSRARSPRSAASRATFLARLAPAGMGSSGHVHLSLAGDGGENLFDPDGHGPVADRPPVHRRDHAPRAGVHGAGVPVRQLLQAPRPGQLRVGLARLRSGGSHDAVPRLRPRPLAQRRVPHPGRRRQPVPGAGGDGGRRPGGHRDRRRAVRGRHARGRGRSATCRTTCATRSTAGSRRSGPAPPSAISSSTCSRVERRHELAVFEREISDIELRRGFEWV